MGLRSTAAGRGSELLPTRASFSPRGTRFATEALFRPVARGLASALRLALSLAAVEASAGGADLAAEARRIVGAGQGVHVESESGTVLVSQAADRAVHPASVSKIPTTLALLRKLGPDHRFETRFLARGPIRAGTLAGPLVVRGGGDPYFVDENAILTVQALRKRGLTRIDGGLLVEGELLFNWKAEQLAPRLRRALEGQVSDEAWRAVRERSAATSARAPRLVFGKLGPDVPGSETLLVTHRSQPLLFMLKALNGYSNNIFAPFAAAAGGIESVEKRIREELPSAYRSELVLGDGAGAHPRNRMSPRATVVILKRLAEALEKHDLDLADVMPVAGVDAGTLAKRLVGPGGQGVVVAKTGTYGDYGACALAGALRTKRHGVVYFAILNRDVPIEEGRRRQDAFVQTLMSELDAEPWPYEHDDAAAFTRAEIATAD